AATTIDHPLLAEALRLFRTWGWFDGFKRLGETVSAIELPMEEKEPLMAWLGGDASRHAEGGERYQKLVGFPPVAAWAIVGRAYRALSAYDFAPVNKLLDEVAAQGAGPDSILEANLNHLRGFLLFRRGQREQGLPLLQRALALLGRDHF